MFYRCNEVVIRQALYKFSIPYPGKEGYEFSNAAAPPTISDNSEVIDS